MLGSVVGGLACARWLAPGYLAGVLGSLRGGVAPRSRSGAGEPRDHRHGHRHARGRRSCSSPCSSRRCGASASAIGPILSFRDPALRQVLRLMAPATIGAAAVQVNVFVNSNFASYLGDGPVSWLNVAFRFMQLPIGLFGVAIGTVTLPLVSRHVARERRTPRCGAPCARRWR